MATPPIFRHIDIGRGRRIDLGERFRLETVAVACGQDERELRPGEFSGAESIVIELTPAKVVRAMRFCYEPGTSFRRMVAGYTEMLGAPVLETADAAIWRDAATEFQLRQDATGPRAVVRSRLVDRQVGEPDH